MKIKSLGLLGLLLLLLLQSCKSKKEVWYMQDVDTVNNTTVNYTNTTLQANDILKITVGALMPETAIPYNKTILGTMQSNSLEVMKLEGYLVSIDQNITFPILGKISVANKTIEALEEDLKNRLETGGHLLNPTVSVRLLNAKVTVLGEVKNPGTFTFTESNITFMQALGLAGDLTINGEREDVILIREMDGTRTVAHFNLTETEFLNSPHNIIKPNDVIVVNPNGAKVKSAGFIGTAASVVAIASLLLSVTILLTN